MRLSYAGYKWPEESIFETGALRWDLKAEGDWKAERAQKHLSPWPSDRQANANQPMA